MYVCIVITKKVVTKKNVVWKTLLNSVPLWRKSTSLIGCLQKEGYVIYSDHYELEDPFFKQWILSEME